MLKNKHILGGILLIIFYSVGIFGLQWDEWRETFLFLTPFNLLLTLGILRWVDGDLSRKGILSFGLIFLIGYFVEVAGVHTGVLFGEYQYGSPLGWQWLEVPLMIGVNWYLLAYGAFGVAGYLIGNKWGRVVLASLLMVGLDVLVEPVAVDLDFWQWAGESIPIRNYFMWFITSLIVQSVFALFNTHIDKRIASYVFLIQVYFFFALNLL